MQFGIVLKKTFCFLGKELSKLTSDVHGSKFLKREALGDASLAKSKYRKMDEKYKV